MSYERLRYFSAEEFGDHADEMDADFLLMLDECRELAGVPFSINSSFRAPDENGRVGGVTDSAHTKGYAVDVHCPSSGHRMRMVQAGLEVGFRRIGIGDTFIHFDNDPGLPQDVMWTY